MNEWVDANIELLRGVYPGLECRSADGVVWVRVPSYRLSGAVWNQDRVDVAFRIPASAGEAPYGFWVHPGLALRDGATILNYTYPATTPWGDEWGQLSFSPAEPWQPKADVRAGPNMLSYALGIGGRLREGA